ncbi:PLCA acyltransferase, partial [Columbina picui]|nr:PLCA acyltransferase [Columbina picui]
SCRGSVMDMVLLHGLLFLLPLAALLLYRYNATFHYFCKVAFFHCWIVVMAIIFFPLALLRGRSVENMKLESAPFQHRKHSSFLSPLRVLQSPLLHPPSIPLVILMPNEWILSSPIHPPGMAEFLPDRCVPIAKKELLYMGIVGWACWLSGFIFINRHKREDAIYIISQTARTIRRENLRVLIFPEGTRNEDKSMLPFKRGAFHLAVQAQVPIIPVVISPYWDFFSSKDKKFTSGTCTIRILPRIETRCLSPKDVPELTETVRQAMVDAFAEMSTGHRGDHQAEQLPRCTGA